LLQWPYLAAGSFFLGGLVATVASLLPRRSAEQHRTAQLIAWCFVAYASLLSFLVGLRWLGFVMTRAMEPGPAWLRLGAAPIALLAFGMIGLGLAGGSLRFVVPEERRSGRLARVARAHALVGATAVLLLCAVPLFPIAESTQRTGFYFDELTLAALQRLPTHAAAALARQLALVRAGLWSTLIVASLVWAGLRGVPSSLPEAWRPKLAWAGLAVVVPIAAVAYATVRAYQAMASVPDTLAPTRAYVLPVGAAVLVGLYAACVAATLLPRPRVAGVPG
jgi:hypothetical protein